MRKPPDFRQMRRKQVRSSLYYYVCLTFEFDLQMESFCVLIESCEILSNFCSISPIQRKNLAALSEHDRKFINSYATDLRVYEVLVHSHSQPASLRQQLLPFRAYEHTKSGTMTFFTMHEHTDFIKHRQLFNTSPMLGYKFKVRSFSFPYTDNQLNTAAIQNFLSI